MNDEPRTTPQLRVRPGRLPEGYGKASEELPWSWVEEQLTTAQNYWICTVDANGRPHAVPVWAAWLDSKLYFDGSPQTRWVRNIEANPEVAVHLENGLEVVIVEGPAVGLPQISRELADRLVTAFGKYDFKYTGDDWVERGLLVLQPREALAWRKFPTDLTRWDFAPQGS